MKVLSEYPETKMTSEQQNASLGETFTELAKRLEEGIAPIFILLGYLGCLFLTDSVA